MLNHFVKREFYENDHIVFKFYEKKNDALNRFVKRECYQNDHIVFKFYALFFYYYLTNLVSGS